MAEGHQRSPKKDYPNDLSVTVSTRKSSREKQVTDRLELDPSKRSYENKITTEPVVQVEDNNSETNNQNLNIPRMARRRCKAEGCNYVVGNDGKVPEGPAGQLKDLEIHLITCPFAIKSKKVVKD